jgi:hypothetical protein
MADRIDLIIIFALIKASLIEIEVPYMPPGLKAVIATFIL